MPRALGELTLQEYLEIQQKGPYTRDPMRVKLVLEPSVVRASLNNFMIESMNFVKQSMRRSKSTRPLLLAL